MRTRYLPVVAFLAFAWFGSPAIVLGDPPSGAWTWSETNPVSISLSYNGVVTVQGPGASPYKVDLSVWATIADSNGTVVASYTSPVAEPGTPISFTLTYDIPKAERVVYWPWDQPLPSAPPVVLTFVGIVHTHVDDIDGSSRDGEDQHVFKIMPTLIVAAPPTNRPTPRPTRQPTASPTSPPTATPSPEPTDPVAPEPSAAGTPIPTASPTSPPSLSSASPSPTMSRSADPPTIAAAVESTGSAGKGGGDQWIILPIVALLGVALVPLYRTRKRQSNGVATDVNASQAPVPILDEPDA